MFLSKDSIPPILSQRRLHLCCSAQNASMLSNAALIKEIIPPQKKGGKDDCIVIVLYIWTIQNHPKSSKTNHHRSPGTEIGATLNRPPVRLLRILLAALACCLDVRCQGCGLNLGSMDFKWNLREKLWVHPVYIWLWKTVIVSFPFFGLSLIMASCSYSSLREAYFVQEWVLSRL